MPALAECLYRLYGNCDCLNNMLADLRYELEEAACYFDSQKDKVKFAPLCSSTGYILYADLFAGNFAGLMQKIPYIVQGGYGYVHIMPPYDRPQTENDGGYAVSSYRRTAAGYGSMDELEQVIKALHKAGIRVAMDFVLNHTSDEHEWALKAKSGDSFYQKFYFMYSDKSDIDRWNSTLREIFPQTRRGSFTYCEQVSKWVWTTFNSFQWDLNYQNPMVFLSMCREMIFLAKLGVDILRFDALAFVWKKYGTCCENLEETHVLIKAFQYAARIISPELLFKSEAIVHPDEVARYINSQECRLSYNPLQMALFWEALATRDTKLLVYSLKKRWHIGEGCAWVNYIRCHDDIGWTFSDEDAYAVGINAYEHRKFLNAFYTGRFPGTFACGEGFQYNPQNGDCRVCGTAASLAGLEQSYQFHLAGDERAELYAQMAIRRLCMIYSVLMYLPGIPLVYFGDENAVLNDYSYKNDSKKCSDERWVHRINFAERGGIDSSAVLASDGWLESKQQIVYRTIEELIKKRKKLFERCESMPECVISECTDRHIFAFTLLLAGKNGRSMQKVSFAANFSEQVCSVYVDGMPASFDAYEFKELTNETI